MYNDIIRNNTIMSMTVARKRIHSEIKDYNNSPSKRRRINLYKYDEMKNYDNESVSKDMQDLFNDSFQLLKKKKISLFSTWNYDSSSTISAMKNSREKIIFNNSNFESNSNYFPQKKTGITSSNLFRYLEKIPTNQIRFNTLLNSLNTIIKKEIIIVKKENIITSRKSQRCIPNPSYFEKNFIDLTIENKIDDLIKIEKISLVSEKKSVCIKKEIIEDNSKSKKRKPIKAWQKQLIWNARYGEKYNAKCFICKTNVITPFNFECGHINAHCEDGSSDISNLDAICVQCNRTMGSMNMNSFIDERRRQLEGNNNKKL